MQYQILHQPFIFAPRPAVTGGFSCPEQYRQKKARKVETIRGLLKIVWERIKDTQIPGITATADQSHCREADALQSAVMTPQQYQGLTPGKPLLYYIGLFNVQSGHAALKTNNL